MIDRSIAPKQNAIEKIEFTKAQTHVFASGIKCHSVVQEDCKVVKIEIEFDAGSKFQKKPLVAAMVNTLLLEGSANYSAFEIASFFDNEGAFLDTSCGADKASVVLHCLERSIPKLLPYLKELLTSVTFPKEEVAKYLELSLQNLQVSQQKVDWVARNEFMQALLGKTHPYSWKIEKEQYNSVTREDLISFYEKQYTSSSFEIYASGKVTNEVLLAIEQVFDQTLHAPKNPDAFSEEVENTSKELSIISLDGSIQSAIRLGALTINRKHADFPALFVANTILGGYFGSRLMSNIREDKGYTYGIGSGVLHLNQLSYFIISTEVGSEVTSSTLKEIELEMNKLQAEPVLEEELKLVKNYLLGNIMKGFDGSFSAMGRFKMLHHHDLGYDYYENLIAEIKAMDAEKIQDVAKRYLDYSQLTKIIAGKL